jgi:putative nucleotidyltransferase with HDIG domain
MNLKEHLEHPILKVIGEIADKMNLETYLVGGFVRDIILDRPCKDYDVVTLGSGIELASAVSDYFHQQYPLAVFKNFGTAMIKLDDIEVEFVGARKESYRSHSRKPIVENGSLEDDQNRRDFTINALAISLNKNSFGELLDSFNGVRDIQNNTIRTPLDPDLTYSDDPLRMMRAIRFATQLNFRIEPSSLRSISRNKDRINIISKERITDELNKIILSPKPSIGFKLLFDTGLLHIIFPQLVKLQVVETIGDKSHKDNFYHTLEVLDNISENTNDLWLRWAAILHDIAKPQTKRFNEETGWTFHGHEDRGARMVPKIFAEMKLPLNEKMKYVQKLVLLHLRPIVLSNEEVTDSAVRRLLFDAGEDIDDLMTLCEADITSKNPKKVKRFLHNFEIVREKLKEVEEKDNLRNWQPPIDGNHIMDAFDITPGKEIGIIKNTIREAILDGHISNDFQAAYQLMLDKGKELGLKAKSLHE